VEQDAGILANAVQQYGALECAGDLTEHVNSLCLKGIEHIVTGD
jgi:hypothetical protein